MLVSVVFSFSLFLLFYIRKKYKSAGQNACSISGIMVYWYQQRKSISVEMEEMLISWINMTIMRIQSFSCTIPDTGSKVQEKSV